MKNESYTKDSRCRRHYKTEISYNCQLNIEYTGPNGEVIENTTTTNSSAPYSKNQTIEISYNPSKPKDIMQGSSRMMISIASAICACLLGFALLNYKFRDNKTYQEFSGVGETFGLARDVFGNNRSDDW